ncbi:SMI1/KNR4 family protein [Streptomyces sp. NPDC056527]|uniref:SMI1/KNR4 family protein n=1 Tax=Streptomyces sp. NPDC056527 TaxID=3345853 RepID=UPI00367D3752
MPYVTSTVSESWARIDAWLRTHAPASFHVLAPPADPDAVEKAQTDMGLRFPPDLLDSLACHDGQIKWANIFPERPPAPVAEIVSFWRMSVDIAGDDPDLCEPHEEGGEPWWHAQWIPWAHSDSDAQVIDMREGPDQGRVGSSQHDDTATFEGGWPSLSAYLKHVADVLDHGGTVGPWAPYLTSGGELWWSFEGQTVLNGSPLTPAPTSQDI